MDPQVKVLLDTLAAQSANAPKMWEVPLAQARAGFASSWALFNAGAPAIPFEDRRVPGPGGEMWLRVYTPPTPAGRPLIVYIHGGGFVLGNPESHHALCAQLAEGTGASVVSVDYRLAPEALPPAQLDDCVAAADWVLANAASLGANPARYVISGDSAGGNLTAATCIRLRDSGRPLPVLQHLIYGSFDPDNTKPSFTQNGTGYLLESEAIAWFLSQYCPTEALKCDPAVWPNLVQDLAGLPPAFMQVGTLDPLLDDTFRYGNRLALAGVPVETRVYPDMIHGFLQLPGMLDGAKRAVADAIAAITAALRG